MTHTLPTLPHSHQPSHGLPDLISQTPECPRNNTSPSCRRIVIDMSDESGDDQPPCLAVPTRILSPSGNGGHIFSAPVPSLSGTGGHVFRTSTHPRSVACDTSVDTPATLPGLTNFNQHLSFLWFCNPHGNCQRVIHCPADNDIGDGDGWYYVTVGRTVGIFNTW